MYAKLEWLLVTSAGAFLNGSDFTLAEVITAPITLRMVVMCQQYRSIDLLKATERMGTYLWGLLPCPVRI